MKQGAECKMRDAKSHRLALVQEFLAETQALTDADENEAWMAEMKNWVIAPHADLSAEVIRRVIEHLEGMA